MPDALQILRRVSVMPPGEMADRLRDRASAELERLGRKPSLPPIPHFAGAPSQRFYPGVRACNSAFVQTNFPQWIDRAVEEAESICRHEFQLLTMDRVTLGPSIDWNQDPYSSRRWESRFWTDYKPQDDPQGRDVKVIHELNRHQHLPRLAAAYLWTGEERYAEEAVAQFESWIDQNPVGYGINWQSSLELAIRSIAWLWTLFPLANSQALTEEAANRIGSSLFAQLEHVYRHLSRYSSPNTHLIGEAAALYIAGVVFAVERWRKTGEDILNAEACKQILNGAVYGELSSCYHCYTVEFYLQAITLARHNQRAFWPKTEAALEGMIDFLMHLTRPNGTLPLLGDDDGGRAFPLGRGDLLSVGAALFHRSDFKHQSREFAQEAFWLLGQNGYEAYRNLPSSRPQSLSALYPSAGYAVQRSDWDSEASHLVFDFGGLGILTGGHAHADSLSINLASHHRAILIDPATFVYNCQPEWRAYFRSTAAHNTVTVDGRNQIEPTGTFSWNHRGAGTHASRAGVDARMTHPWLEAEHNFYAHIGVTHRRSILSIPGEYLVILDRFAGAGHHRFDLHYHFNPAVDPQLDVSIIEGLDFSLALHATTALDCSMHIGEKNPLLGWASNGYGELHPIPTLRASMTHNLTATNAAIVSILSLGANRPRIHRLSIPAGQGIALAVEQAGHSDTIAFAPDGNPLHIGPLKTHGEFFWMRMHGGSVHDALSVHATRFEYDGVNLLEETLCAPSAAF